MLLLQKVKNNKVFKNFSYLTIGNAVSQFLSLITVLKITNFFTPNDYGLFTFITTQGLLLFALSELGIKQIIIRAISRNPERTNDLIFNGLFLRFISVFSLTGLYFLYNEIFGTLTFIQVILIGACALGSAFWDVLEYSFLGHQKMFFPSLFKIIYSSIWFTSIFLIPGDLLTVNYVVIVYILLNFLLGIACLYIMKKQNLFIGEIKGFWSSSKMILSESWPYFSVMLIMIPIQSFHNIYLEVNSTVEEIGYFNLSGRLLSPVQLVLDYALIAAFPSLSALWVIDKVKFNKIVKTGFQYFIIVGSTLAFLFSIYVEEIVIFLFPGGYLPAVQVTKMQVWYTFLMAVNRTISIIFGASNNEKLLFKLSILNATISIPMLYIGSKYGAVGLSIGYVLSFSIMEVYLWYRFKKVMDIKITRDKIAWSIAIILFILAYFIPLYINFVSKIFISVLLLSGILIYISKNYKKDYATI